MLSNLHRCRGRHDTDVHHACGTVQIMNNEIKMNVSLLSTTGDKRVIYVVFTDGDKSAEFSMPEVKLVRNEGFTEEEITQLTDYAGNSIDEIYKIAKTINPIKSFMKEKI